MEEKEINAKELFAFMNNEDGEFFVRVVLNEEGGLYGETDECDISETSEGYSLV